MKDGKINHIFLKLYDHISTRILDDQILSLSDLSWRIWEKIPHGHRQIVRSRGTKTYAGERRTYDLDVDI